MLISRKAVTGHYESGDSKDESQLGMLVYTHVLTLKSSRPVWATKDQNLKGERAGEMPQQIKEFASRLEDLSSVLRTHVVEETDS